jgi:DNA-binding NarL/FixJ family response regulator
MVSVRVLVVDDHPLVRQGLVLALQLSEGRATVVGEADSAAAALAMLAIHPVDVAVIDVMMPQISGISLAAEIATRHPSCRILGLSVIDEPGLIADMLRSSAGYALKTQPVEEIVEAIHQVAAGNRYLPPSISKEAIDTELAGHGDRPMERLTKREREVFELLIRGHSNDEIATRLFIARRTVETHRQRIMNKLSVHSIVQMLRMAAKHGGLGL